MALSKSGLGFPVECSYDSTTTIYANPASTTTYIRSLLFHNVSANAVNVALHFVQNSGGSVGSTATSNRILKITLDSTDTYFMELAFPIVLTGENDSLRIVNANTTAGDSVTVTILGDREA
jgi:hypothetical protein